MPFRRRSLFSCICCAPLAAGLLLLAGGCGSGGGGKLVPVTGAVTVDGAPLAAGSVAFHPDAAKGNKSDVTPGSEVDAGGKYTLFTSGKAGAPPGWYKVTVTEKEELDSTKPESKSKVNRSKYADPEKTPLTVEVKEGAGADAYKLPVKLK